MGHAIFGEENARIPVELDALGEDVFYINNTLVPERDGCRIIGPLNKEKMEFKRQQYESIE